ncbi:DUF305 domain-containing protein [Streptomyces sp. NPDC006798]|uniref:DUF305 domain-containing protein n=1 Tax=Streptomyces sp. NPDC006798 TaxID=3155462 RepID=UPI0034012745
MKDFAHSGAATADAITTDATATGSGAPRGPRRRAPRRTAVVSAVVAAGLLLAACGGDDGDDMAGMDHGKKDSASASAAPGGGDNPAPGAFNDTDVMFAQMMIPHHQQALEMSALAEGRAKDADVIRLAKEIAAAQDPEITTMRAWLKAWGKPESATDHGSHGSGGGAAMDGMMTEEQMAALKAAKGTDFDREFARLMIEHHKGAITMAEEERTKGRNATAKKLAAEVVRTQQAEVDTFTAILKRL